MPRHRLVPFALASSLCACAVVLVAAAYAVLSSSPAEAGPTFTVTRTDDPAPDGCLPADCTLREAVIAANDAPGADVIDLPAGTYTLAIPSASDFEFDPALGDIDISHALTINGAGSATTIVDADGLDRAFETVPNNGNFPVSVSGVTIRNGDTTALGGAIRVVDADLSLTDSVIEDSSAGSGGGLSVAEGGSATLTNVQIRRNEATTGLGGGVHVLALNSLTIIDSTIADNTSADNGAGIYTLGADIQGSTITGNFSDFDGGGVNSDGITSITTISDTTISDNEARSGDGGGVRIQAGILDLSDSEVSDNTSSDDAGGVDVDEGSSSALITNTLIINNSGGIMDEANGGGLTVDGSTVVEDSTVSGNTVGNDGGGIYSSGPLTIINSTVSGNEAEDDGGGLYLDDGVITNPQNLITDNTITDNHAGDNGGGIDTEAHLTVTGTTISGNIASGSGGGINNDETANLLNTTISGNHASGVGGGMRIENPGDTASLHHVTLVENSIGAFRIASPASGGAGAGLHVENGFAQYSNTIFADNSGGPSCFALNATLQSNGLNIDEGSSCADAGDLPNTDPLLGPLADNGGPTETHALMPDSPAVDAATANCPVPIVDQRGVSRPQGDACDIGAFELVVGAAATWGDDDCNGAVAATDALKNLQEIAAIPYTQTDPCFALGEPVGVQPAGFGAYPWGDVDCNGSLASTDALAILRSLAALPVNQQPNCPEIGEGVLIVP